MELIKAKLEDNQFLYEVYASSRMAEVNGWHWDEQQKQQFLQMQYQIQETSYKHNYLNLETEIIIHENKRVGRLLLADLMNKLIIVDLTILPQFQGKGIGTKILLDTQDKAKSQGKNIQLSVNRCNIRAKILYERLEFQEVERTDMYVFMEWEG